MPTDIELLRRYVEHRDEQAFAEFVQRHLALVYSSALGRTAGRTHLAEEITQRVFSDLARKAAGLLRHPALAGWLYRSTRYVAIDAMRGEFRRQKLVQSLTTMLDESSPEPAVDWERLRPVLYAAMDLLKQRDREIILWRFFDGLTFSEVGQKLNLAENAARMRTERAMDKLRMQLARRGVTSTAAALGLLLANPSFAAVPNGLANAVTTAVLAAPAASGSGLVSFFLMSKITAPAISAVAAAGLTAVTWFLFVHGVSAKELAGMRQENIKLMQATADGASAASLASVAGEFAVRATTIARAVEVRHSRQASPSPTALNSAPAPAIISSGRHRFQGQATPMAAVQSFAWAADAGDVEELSKLVWFAPKDREQAVKVLASMPESLRARYSTPEELYAFFFAADALVSPPPGADLIDHLNVVPLAPDRVAMRWPGSTKNFHQYQLTPDGWKYVVPPAGVRYAPGVLNNETLAKLASP